MSGTGSGSKQPIHVGFIGLSTSGWASHAVGGPLIRHPEYRLVAVSTSSPVTAKASAEKYTNLIKEIEEGKGNSGTVKPVKGYYGSSEHIVKDEDVDVIAVAVKSTTHVGLMGPVLEAGKPFLLEWPAGRNIEDTKRIERIAREKGLRHAVPLQGRHGLAMSKVREILKSGKIGKVLSTSMICLSPLERDNWAPLVTETTLYTMDPANGATFIDIILGHHLDTFTFVMGSDFSSVTATTAQLYPEAKITERPDETVHNLAPDHIALSGNLKSGAFVNMVWRTGYPSGKGRQQFIWEIDGTEGSIRLTHEDGNRITAYLHLWDPKVYLNGEEVEMPEETAGRQAGHDWNVSRVWDELAKTLRGEESESATLTDAIRLHTLLEAIKKSANEGVRVDL